MSVLSEAMQEIVRSARAGFGHIEGRTDEECLVLQWRQMSRVIAERTRDLEFYMARAKRLELEAAEGKRAAQGATQKETG